MRNYPQLFFNTASTLATFTLLLGTPGVVQGAGYTDAVLSDQPLGYYRFNDSTQRTTINLNSGSLGAAANATNDVSVMHPFPGALAGNGDRSGFFDGAARTIIPFEAGVNPPNTTPFTMETWLYPASDQINGGQCPINNRYAYSGANRQGWVIFQRAQDDSYSGKPGYEGVGWNFRMYNENGSSSGLDVTSQLPYHIGQWTHLVVVYAPNNLTDATLTMYINGVPANTNIWAGTVPGYAANTSNHDASEAVNGPSGLAFGQYNNTASPNSNPYFGAVDEFAFYTNKLTDAQILAHYQNGTNASRATPYEALIKSDGPVAYLRFNELTPWPDVALNMGNLQASGLATYSPKATHPAASAVASEPRDGSYAGHNRAGGGSFVDMPWLADNNPDASVPFSLESWFRPTGDDVHNGKSPMNNRLANGAANRTGWVIFQRDPNPSYTGTASSGEGMGWAFRPYIGGGSSSGGDVVTTVPYNLNEWQHVVFTWDPQTDVSSDSSNGGILWEGILTAYVNGIAVQTNSASRYQANSKANLAPDDSHDPVDFAIGAYNVASGGGSEFEGDIDEVAFYSNYLLKPEQVLAHYQAGTNSHPATNYETLVLTAAYDSSKDQRTMPATYLRFNEPAFHPAANSGSLGSLADGALVLTTNSVAGPVSPALPGFESTNLAVPLDGTQSWVSLNNPTNLNVAGQIALEAWIKPNATQGDLARIISHGPPTFTADTTGTVTNNVVSGSEVFLRVEGAGATYAFGSSDGTSTHAVTFPVPAGDMGSANWIHLVGTYDGSHWTLFRNGAQVASVADPVGALAVNNADWAIGSTGDGWADNFAGAIDEAAIYSHALTPARVQAHYAAATAVTGPSLAISLAGGKATITWSSGTLQQADNVTGTFTDVPAGPKSPYAITPAGTAKFYRLRQ